MKTIRHIIAFDLSLSLLAFVLASGQTNFRIHPSSIHQGKVCAVRNPLNPDMVFAVGFSMGPVTRGYGMYRSTDGGISWSGTDTAAPVWSGRKPLIIDRHENLMVAQTGSGTDFGLYVIVSSDFGITWLPRVSVPGANAPDVVTLGTDDVASSPFYGRSYITWTSFGTSYANRIVFSYTPDGGASWSVATPVSPPPSAGHFHHGGDIRVGPNGYVYVVWANSMQSGDLTEDSLGIAVSTNGGASWDVSTNGADDMNGIRSANFFNTLRVNGFPNMDVDRSGGPRNGWIYVASAEKNLPPYAADLADIVLHRSTDNGLTWTRSRVNQDTPGNGKYQYYPSLVVDDDGGVNVLYVDSRNIATNDSTEAYLSRSTDGGSTWSDTRVSDHRFKPKLVSTPSGGSFDVNGTSMTSTSDHLLPLWSDDAAGVYQIWGDREPMRSLTIISPNGGEVWHWGETHNLIWRSVGVDTVTIEFSSTGSAGPWVPLIAGYSGRDTLSVPNPLVESSNCFYLVTANSSPAVFDTNDAPFTIVPAPTSIWQPQASGTTLDLYSVKAISPSVAWAGGIGGVVRRTTNGGNTWTSAGALGADIYSLTALDANTALVAVTPAAAKVYKTTNGGQTWVLTDSVNSTGAFFDAIEMNSPTTGFVLGDPVGGHWLLRQTSDAGNTWFNGPAIPWSSFEGLWTNCMTWYDSLHGWFYSSPGYIYRTTSAGAFWSGMATPSPPGPVWFNQLTLGLSGPGLRSTDAGASWSQTQGTIPEAASRLSGIGGSTRFWATAGHSIYFSTNAGDSWNNSQPSGYSGSTFLNDISVTQLGNISAGWAVGSAGTILHFVFGEDGVKEREGEMPQEFSLSQNYPNPFNPVTSFQLSIVNRQLTILKVYDVLGREVATLVNEEKQPGRYQVTWNASNAATGVYICRLQAGIFSQTRKLLLIR